MSHMPIADLQCSLEPIFGIEQARYQILMALRDDRLRGTCASFLGVNPNCFSVVSYPEEATDFELPGAFWGHPQFAHDGPTSWRIHQISDDVWTSMVSWSRGDFSISGSYQNGKLPNSLRAKSVQINVHEARSFLKYLKVPMNFLVMRGSSNTEAMLAWTIGWISDQRANGQRIGQDEAWPAFRVEFPNQSRTTLRELHTLAKAELGIIVR